MADWRDEYMNKQMWTGLVSEQTGTEQEWTEKWMHGNEEMTGRLVGMQEKQTDVRR